MTSISKFTPSNFSLTATCQKSQLAQWMHQCREATLALFTGIDYEAFCYQAHPDFSPIGWHLGHIAYTEALWLLQRCAGQPACFPQYHRLFAQDGLPKHDRVHLPELPEVVDYLAQVRSRVLEYLEVAPLEQQERLWRWLLQHESQHCETIAIVLALQNFSPSLLTPSVPNQLQTGMVKIPAGMYHQGYGAIEALDNERPVRQIELADFWIDRYPVTCQQYRQFMQAGGYSQARWWSAEGWQWLQANPVTQPLYWQEDSGYDHHPVCGVSWYEADAYARFVGKRLPTEVEWETAASWQPQTHQKSIYPWGNDAPDTTRCNYLHLWGTTTPVDRFPLGQSASGCYDLLGNVWEWTSTLFDGYPGFEAYPYPGYSQAYFDGAHHVLKGGSWTTRPWALRSSFRNWYHPGVRQIFAGVRCVTNET